MFLVPGYSFIWLFPGGYEALAFSHQRVTFYFPADTGLQALFFLAHNIFDALQTPSSFFLLVYSRAALDLGWNTLCMAMSFHVPMSIYFRSSRLQLTTVTRYLMTETAKVLIAVTLFLLESLFRRIHLIRFLYSEVASQRTSLSLFLNDCNIPRYLQLSSMSSI